MSKPRDPHRKHQQLMQKLTILNARISGVEKQIRNGKGKLNGEKWEGLHRELKSLNSKKEDLNYQIRNLER